MLVIYELKKHFSVLKISIKLNGENLKIVHAWFVSSASKKLAGGTGLAGGHLAKQSGIWFDWGTLKFMSGLEEATQTML